MQTQELIRTIRWIESVVHPIEEFLFLGRGEVPGISVVSMFREVGKAMTLLSENANARKVREVLEAFDLGVLVSPQAMDEYIQELRRREREQQKKESNTLESNTVVAWRTMIGCVASIETLTTPQELRGDEVPGDIVTFEIRHPTQETTPIPQLARVVSLIEEAYESVSIAYSIKNIRPLTLVKVESGSGIRIDCKGLGEAIKHLKDLILEVWRMFRHKRPEVIIENNKAFLSSLEVMEKIAEGERNGTLGRELAEQSRRKIIVSVTGLLECGALISEIPEEETVHNTQLLSGFTPKQLLPPKGSPRQSVKRGKSRTPRKPKESRLQSP